MGAQASTSRDDGDLPSDRESVSSVEDQLSKRSPSHEPPAVATGASVGRRVRSPPPREEPSTRQTRPPPAMATTARPPVAPTTKKNVVADRVVEIRGTIKHAFPLQSLKKQQAQEENGDEFSLGSGPCGRDAAQFVAWEVQLHDSYETCYVFLYDQWTDAVSRFQRHYKVHVRGSGLVVVDHWDIGHDTEDVKRCYIVAEQLLLKRTAERSPRLLPKPQGMTIEIAFEEPQKIPESDQVKYLPEQVIRARDLYASKVLPVPATATGKTALQPTKPLVMTKKPNPRGKRTLTEMNTAETGNTGITTPSSYVYTPLAELIPGNACVYGVVVNMSLPKRSEGYDYYMSLHIVDESRPRREDALQVMVFLPTIEQMPRILVGTRADHDSLFKHVGDIVRFHKIRINRYQDKLQGVCNSRATRYLVLRRGKDDPLLVEQQSCTASWTFEKYDEERFTQLTHWADRALHIDTTLPPGCPQPARLLRDMQFAESFADLVVRVLHIQEPYEDFTAARMIVWDGSGDATTCQDLYSKLAREQQTNPNTVSFIPHRGLLMEVIVDSCWVVMQTMGILPELKSHWCRFRNLAVSSEQGEPSSENPTAKHWFELHFREVSSVMLVPASSSDVEVRRKDFSGDDLVVNSFKTTPGSDVVVDLTQDGDKRTEDSTQRVVTQVPNFITEKVPVTTLKTVLASPHVPRKYHCATRVVAIWPSEIAQLAKPKSAGDDTYIYSFVMRLEDDTGQIDAIVHGDDAETFVHGIPPCDLSKSTSSLKLLQKRVRGLLVRQQPLHFCIKSYKPKSASEGDQESVRFRVFDTLLLTAP